MNVEAVGVLQIVRGLMCSNFRGVKIFQLQECSNPPLPFYSFFLSLLKQTVVPALPFFRMIRHDLSFHLFAQVSLFLKTHSNL